MSKKIYDIAIIGGGPVGIFTAYYAAMRTVNPILIESMPKLGGQPANLYAQKQIYDIAGQFGISGRELIDNLLQTKGHFHYNTKLQTTVTNIQKVPNTDYFSLETNGENIWAKSVIIAIGNGPFEPRKLAVKYDPQLEKNQLAYFVKDLNTYKDQDVLIAGGGDTAIDWALAINKIAHKTFLLHRRDTFRALESSITSLQKSDIEVLTPNIITDVQEINADSIQVTFQTVKSKDIKQITVNKLLVNYGIKTDSRLLRGWQLDLKGPFIKVDSQMRTNRPLIYAVGDVVYYPGKKRLIALGFAEGPIAVNTAIAELYPDKTKFGHSSSLFN
ncbi:NAD(P)/FAD-dependent oxidoreductase [Bombilactobacillus thymidiniphilus]|uniref:Ferredoxin--NADP reductase n=1 Tax=Bombilactobacillus thymidiniphilus TaxID=2923363 RepID=A0ABY4PED8_9LACO|nr:NAD(P)/FAD-dependent oxidoreductase [Bombilactobacillus thymidiniphilus]UQS83871.1 NAD(P)/FAD-dependent oxidoreductase [Bombilactobacillus thymidiniphilus]